MSETIEEKVAYYRAKHREWQQMGPGDRYEQHDAIGVLFRALDAERERAERAEAEVADLKQTVIAFAGPEAVRQAAYSGYCEGVLHPHHYDLLERCGARMVDFQRGELPAAQALKDRTDG